MPRALSLSPPNNLPVQGLFGSQGPGEGKLSREEVVAAGVLATLRYLTALGLLRFLLEPVSAVAVPGRRGTTATPGEGPFPAPGTNHTGPHVVRLQPSP